MASNTHRAPWSLSLIFISLFTSLVCLGVSMFIWRRAEEGQTWLTVIPIAIVVVASLFTVRGYTLTPKFLRVHRLVWSTRIPLDGLQSVEFDPQAILKSKRIFGNEGVFSMSGYFRSKKLGKYRAFVSQPALAVILRFPEHTVVVSPGIPKAFVEQIEDAGILPNSEE